VRFDFLTAVTEDRFTIFWNVTRCSLVEVGQRFRRTCCLHRQYGRQEWQRSPLKRWWIQPDHMTSFLRRQLTLSVIQNHFEIKQFPLSFLYNLSCYFTARFQIVTSVSMKNWILCRIIWWTSTRLHGVISWETPVFCIAHVCCLNSKLSHLIINILVISVGIILTYKQ